MIPDPPPSPRGYLGETGSYGGDGRPLDLGDTSLAAVVDADGGDVALIDLKNGKSFSLWRLSKQFEDDMSKLLATVEHTGGVPVIPSALDF